MRSCRELGIQSVAVHSTADEDSLHVKLADESVCIGPAKSTESYLNIPTILSAAEITGSVAIHPGYGFLSENQEFAQCCEKWNIKFVGPRASIINDMGDKIRSKELARKAGVPVLNTIKVNRRSDHEIKEEVLALGFPVLIKASAGGGGRGMRKIDKLEDLFVNIERLKEESRMAFGDDTLFIEKFVANPRHIEVQILGDNHGNVIHLGERDCTVQRRFQKIIEEAPSPVLSAKKREEICHSAVELAKMIDYNSVGTVEFLYDMDDQKFYFMEMNTRIQVEHPVTEELTGVDLIAQQILMAQNERLKLEQKDIEYRGHVVEVRVNAEDPKTGAPSPGKIEHYHRPGGPGVRVDDFIYSGYHVPPFYDSMISKVIVNAVDREACLNRLNRCLSEMVVSGISTNIDQHKQIINHADFRGNNYNTHFIEKNFQ
jgi:acetyl-CoA carboxylase biotin carboxylase subunit